MAATVNVSGISAKTSEDEIKSFFSFCGKISHIEVKPAGDDTKTAVVTFEKGAAAKTALLLDNTQLGPNSVHVTSEKASDELDTSASPAHGKDDHHIAQEEKPRSRIIAEYLAQGYAISDNVIEKALALDKQHGMSTKFIQTLQNFDSKFHASERAQAVDQKFGATDKIMGAWRGLTSYFDKAADTPTGQKLRNFYEAGNKTVIDVHNEARHLADLKKASGTDKSACKCGGDGKSCNCPDGKCVCSGCSKKEQKKTSTCNCGGNASACSCPGDKCACSGCSMKEKESGATSGAPAGVPAPGEAPGEKSFADAAAK